MADVCFQRTEVVISRSVVDWDISPKFGMLVDFDLPKWAKPRKPKPKVELRCRGRYLENGYDVITMSRMVRFERNLVGRCKPMVTQTWIPKLEVEFQHGGRLFSVTGSSTISAVTSQQYLAVVWYAGILWPSQMSEVTKTVITPSAIIQFA